jgi:hypothetical protein
MAEMAASAKAADEEIGIAVVEGENPVGQVREVMHIQLAHESGLGQMNLAEGAVKHLRL